VLLALWPNLAVTVKRWHDMNLSGWWSILSFVPYVWVIALIYVGLGAGTIGANRFGVDPLREPWGSNAKAL
jgi:uncharacterized membrane protein YhaH (DUF805 family)